MRPLYRKSPLSFRPYLFIFVYFLILNCYNNYLFGIRISCSIDTVIKIPFLNLIQYMTPSPYLQSGTEKSTEYNSLITIKARINKNKLNIRGFIIIEYSFSRSRIVDAGCCRRKAESSFFFLFFFGSLTDLCDKIFSMQYNNAWGRFSTDIKNAYLRRVFFFRYPRSSSEIKKKKIWKGTLFRIKWNYYHTEWGFICFWLF